ncbi:MAG: hypothetical protein MUF40_06450 [Gemmatimonadaceae bacterium]|nr:hypothetical protein [Gemmatimonadaceae bacterium]
MIRVRRRRSRGPAPPIALLRVGALVATLASPLASQAWRVGVSAEASHGRGTPVVGRTEPVTLVGGTVALRGPLDAGVRAVALLGEGRRGGALGTTWLATSSARPFGLSAAATHLVASGTPAATRADVGVEGRWRSDHGPTASARLFAGTLRRDRTGGGDAGLDLVLTAPLGRHAQLSLVTQATLAVRDASTLWFLRLSDDLADIGRGPVRRHVVDLAPTLRLAHRGVVLDAAVTTRIASGSPSLRTGALATVEFPIAGAVRGTLGAGAQLPDVRLLLGRVRWVSAGLRIALAPRRIGAPPPPRLEIDAPLLGIERTRIVVQVAPHVRRVLIRGDFTDFTPRPCTARGTGRFDCGSAPAPGPHRVALQLDDAAWRAPGNLAVIADDFGGSEGDWLVPGEP